MKSLLCVCAGVLLLGTSASWAASPLGGMKLLDGYKHVPLQGIDSIVGEIKKEGGLKLVYEIGSIPKPGQLMLGGGFIDRPQLTPDTMRRWYREQVVNGQKVHLAHRKDNVLLVSFPQKGMNVSVTVKTPEEMADALLMILTYPNPVDDEAVEIKE
jgi:hypothetical protein